MVASIAKEAYLMRILLVTHFFPPTHNAGTENYTLGLAQALQARGHQVEVICAEDWETGKTYLNDITREEYGGVSVLRIHLNWTKATNPNQVLFDSLPVEQWFDEFLRTNKPDVVHVTSTYSLGIGILRAVRRVGIASVLTLMDFWFICPRTILLRADGQLCTGRTTPWECQQCLLMSSNFYRRTQSVLSSHLHPIFWYGVSQMPLLARLRGARGMALDMAHRKAEMKKVLELTDIILSHSSFVQRVFAQVGLSEQVIHLRNGLDLDWAARYQGKSDSPVLRFGYMGQITAMKGVHVLLEAFQVANLIGFARLDIWGDLTREPSYVQQLRQLITNPQSITLRGGFLRTQLASVLAEIDVLVVPSMWYENAPLVIQEAFATKTPVIATNLGGMAEAIMPEVNGLLFERGDVEGLSKQLRRIIHENGLLENLRNGILPVKTVDDEINELEAIYRRLLTVPAALIKA